MCEVCGQAVLDVKAHVARMHSETKPAGKLYICPVRGSSDSRTRRALQVVVHF